MCPLPPCTNDEGRYSTRKELSLVTVVLVLADLSPSTAPTLEVLVYCGTECVWVVRLYCIAPHLPAKAFVHLVSEALHMYLVSFPEKLKGRSGKRAGVEVYTAEFLIIAEPSVSSRVFC